MIIPESVTMVNGPEILAEFKGTAVQRLPAPAAVVDRGIVASHCKQMLDACRVLDVGFRAHVKTHKTLECTKLQVGDEGPINLVVSTIPEIRILKDWLIEEKGKGRAINVLYSMPLPISAVQPLAALSSDLGAGGLSLMIDNVSQLMGLSAFPHPPRIFLKVDTGYHRAGLPASSAEFSNLADAVLTAQTKGLCYLQGLYSHASHSYTATSADDAMSYLTLELTGAAEAARAVRSRPLASALTQHADPGSSQLLLSVGATPSATSAQNLVAAATADPGAAAKELRATLDALAAEHGARVELHAGVYPFLDMQQLSTQASPSFAGGGLAPADIAFTVLADVASVYPARSPPQALVAAGCLALGREPCPRYTGSGVVSAWGLKTEQLRASPGGWAAHRGDDAKGLERRSGWAIGKMSQEHGILFPEESTDWQGAGALDEAAVKIPFIVGQKVRIFPNHACIAAAGFGFFFVVDGSDEVVDVWARCRGW